MAAGCRPQVWAILLLIGRGGAQQAMDAPGRRMPTAEKSGFCHLFYTNADTNLERFQVADMTDVLYNDAASKSFSAFLYIDRNGIETSTSDRAMKYLIDEDGKPTPEKIETAIYARLVPHEGWGARNRWIIEKRLGELDSLSMSTFVDFARWALARCEPTQYKVLSFSMHGGGMEGLFADETNDYSKMSVHTLGECFAELAADGLRFDLVGFDTCLMSEYSVAQALFPYASYMLASEPEEPAYGWDYGTLDTRASDPLAYAKNIIDVFLDKESGPNQLVLTDLGRFSVFRDAFRPLIAKMTNAIRAGDEVLMVAITRAREEAAEYPAFYESFEYRYEILDTGGNLEKSQMDLGSFLWHLHRMCQGLEEVPGIWHKLHEAIMYKQMPGSFEAVCTGEDCAPGSDGLALFFKKRRWMLGAYAWFMQKYDMTLEEVLQERGVMVDAAMDASLRTSLPDWYGFLAAYYTFEKRDNAADNVASVCNIAGHPNLGGDEQQGPAEPAPPAEPTSTSSWVACEDHYGAFCSTVGHEALPDGRVVVSLPAQGDAYETDVSGVLHVYGPSRTHFSQFGLEAGSHGTCPFDFLTVGGTKYCGTELMNYTLDIQAEASETFLLGSDSGTTGPGFVFTVTPTGPRATPTPPATQTAITPLGQAGAGVLAQSTDSVVDARAEGPCLAGGPPFCTVEKFKRQNGDLQVRASVARWVASVELYIGFQRRPAEVAWALQLPIAFVNASSLTAMWPGAVPYLSSANDGCAALATLVHDGAAVRDGCDTRNFTLSLPVRYFKKPEDVNAGKFLRGAIKVVLGCRTLEPSGPMVLEIPNEFGLVHDVPGRKGGLVQPLIRVGSEASWDASSFQACDSAAPFPWGGGINFTFARIGDEARLHGADKFYAHLVARGLEANLSTAGSGSEAAGSPTLTFTFDKSMVENVWQPAKERTVGESTQWWPTAVDVALLVALLVGSLLLCALVLHNVGEAGSTGDADDEPNSNGQHEPLRMHSDLAA